MKRAIVDLSSLIWTNLLMGRDKELGREYRAWGEQLELYGSPACKEMEKAHGDGKKVYVNSAIYGYENAIQYLTTVLHELEIPPTQVILVKEGKNSKADRQCLHPEYKAGRDKYEPQYEEFNKCRDMVIDVLLSVGANMCWQDGGVEADDVIGYLANNLDGERWIISGDKDLAQVVGGDVHQYRSGKVDENPFAPFEHRLIPVWIALVGDSADKIPGAPGFGQKAGENLLATFGEEGLALMEKLILDKKLKRLAEDVHELPVLQKIVDNESSVYLSYELGRLRLEKVNTVRRPLEWQVGMVKPRQQIEDERLRKFGGAVKLVHADAYDEAYTWAKKMIAQSEWVTLDIESSTPPESDEWLERQGKDADAVDVFGSELTSVQLTFGPNMQYTVYLPFDNVEEADAKNLSLEQIVAFVDLIPRSKLTVVHNAAFELPVCFNAWGKRWESDPDYHGFLRNVIDSRIMSSYVNENRSAGLKSLSKDLLGYDQVSYQQVTTKTILKSAWDGSGKLLREWAPMITDTVVDIDEGTGERTETVVEIPQAPMVDVQFKMNQLRAREVLSYGADDTICTAAVAGWFRIIMELERTWRTFMEVEQFPAYLTAKGYIDGVDFSLEDMAEMEADDNKAYDEAWPVLRDYLIKVGFDGTVCPVYTELTAASIKEIFTLLAPGHALKTQVRTASKLGKMITIFAEGYDGTEGREEDAALLEDSHLDKLRLFATLVEAGDLASINDLVKANFNGEPQLDLASPKQMGRLLYDFMGLPINIVNKPTQIEKIHAPDLAAAVLKFGRIKQGKALTMTDEEMKLLRKKAKADEDVINFALAFDADRIAEDARAALKAIGVMKKVMTRRSLFYKNYWFAKHWKDGKIHASANQCAAVTRRYSMSSPNLQQLPKKGEGVRFRGCFKPHRRDAVICSIDFSGQELRLAAEVSQDRNMLACYVGDNLKDIHSITAAGAMKLKWGAEAVRGYFESYGTDLDNNPEGLYTLFLRLRKCKDDDALAKKADDHRKSAKVVNFAAQNGAGAQTISEKETMLLTDAQLFLDARGVMFPDVAVAAKAAEEKAKSLGYATTLLGARRHLRDAITSDDRGAASRAARQAWNFEIQGSAGEMTKLAMAKLWKSDFLWKYDTRFIAPIHDELVTSIHVNDVVEAVKIKHDCMTQPYASMTVPILGSISIGPDFADQNECGDWYIEPNIKAALDKIFKRQPAEAAA